MALAFFYIEEYSPGETTLVLNEETSKHAIQVLRMQNGDQLQLTDGKGNLITAEITDDNRKKCSVKILSTEKIPRHKKNVSIAISLIKNQSRFEWFLEKVTELGVTDIIPLICERTEKQKFRADRLKNILVSAMLQSQQSWLPVLHEPAPFNKLVIKQFNDCKKFIAHCLPESNKVFLHHQTSKLSDQLILIGPEGDFSKTEIELALKEKFIPVSLGETRLRTETAGIIAATLLQLL